MKKVKTNENTTNFVKITTVPPSLGQWLFDNDYKMELMFLRLGSISTIPEHIYARYKEWLETDAGKAFEEKDEDWNSYHQTEEK